MNTIDYEAARGFLNSEGRLVERRLFATLFEEGPAAAVVDALRGYQNPDGGFGHGLEPDKRCPASLPIDVEVALQTMAAAGAHDGTMVLRACDWLASVAEASGAVPLAFPVIEAYPRAEHWAGWAYEPGLFPTAGLAGLLYRLDVEHPWRDAATASCWSAIAAGVPAEGHVIAEVLAFLEHVPDRDRASRAVPGVAARLRQASSFRAEADDPSYGVTPLHLAPSPDSPWRSLFDDGVVAAHLDRLAGDQQPDGGWPLTWKPPSAAADLEWRGIETLRALRVLAAYDR